MALRYWCHSCNISRDTKIENDIRACGTCNCEFIEELKHENVNRVESIRVLGESSDSDITNTILNFIRSMEDRQIIQLREEDNIRSVTSQTFEEEQSKEIIKPICKKYRDSLCETMLSNEEIKELCYICHDDFNKELKVIRLECTHFYHRDCIDNWFDKQHTCPICRYQFPKADSSEEE